MDTYFKLSQKYHEMVMKQRVTVQCCAVTNATHLGNFWHLIVVTTKYIVALFHSLLILPIFELITETIIK